MVINTIDGMYEVASMEDISGLYRVYDDINTRVSYVNSECQGDRHTINDIANDLSLLKNKVDRLIEMYGVIQLRCEEDMGISHVNLSDHGDLSGLFGGNI